MNSFSNERKRRKQTLEHGIVFTAPPSMFTNLRLTDQSAPSRFGIWNTAGSSARCYAATWFHREAKHTVSKQVFLVYICQSLTLLLTASTGWVANRRLPPTR